MTPEERRELSERVAKANRWTHEYSQTQEQWEWRSPRYPEAGSVPPGGPPDFDSAEMLKATWEECERRGWSDDVWQSGGPQSWHCTVSIGSDPEDEITEDGFSRIEAFQRAFVAAVEASDG